MKATFDWRYWGIILFCIGIVIYGLSNEAARDGSALWCIFGGLILGIGTTWLNILSYKKGW